MATLNIEEYGRLAQAEHGSKLQVPGPLLAKQSVTIGSSSAAFAALNSETKFLVLVADQSCHYEEDAAATTASRFVPPNTPRLVSLESVAPTPQVIESDDTTVTVFAGDVQITAGNLFVGDTANANMTAGLTLNQGASDDEITALKSSDVAHGMTNFTETDSYGFLKKQTAAQGGVNLSGFNNTTAGTTDAAMFILGVHGATPDTTDTSASFGILRLSAAKKSGVGSTACAATENVASVDSQGVTKWLIKGNGDVHQTTDAHTALDNWDDMQLLEAYDSVRTRGQVIQDTWNEMCRYNEQDLIEAGIFGKAGRKGLTNVTQLQKLLVGAARQSGRKIADLTDRLAFVEKRLLQ